MKQLFAIILVLSCSLHSNAQEEPIHIYNWLEVQNASEDTIYGISFEKLKLTEVPIELRRFKQLKTLILDKNKLEKLPDFIDEFHALTTLSVSKNKLELFPVVICRLTSIERIVINRNYIESVPACIENCEKLSYLDVYDCPIRSIPESLTSLKHLQEIDFSGIRFSTRFQETWTGKLPNVKLVFDAPCDCME